MTILNNYSQLYWLTRLDGIKGFSVTVLVICGILSIATFLWVAIEGNWMDEEKLNPLKKWRNGLFIATFVFGLISIFIPTKNEMIFIYAGGKTMDFIDSDTSINKIPAQTTKIITDYLEKQIKETNEDGKKN